jgi:hypothetical protein
MFERTGHIITSSMQGHFSICCAAIVAAVLEIVITGTLRNCCDRGSEREFFTEISAGSRQIHD